AVYVLPEELRRRWKSQLQGLGLDLDLTELRGDHQVVQLMSVAEREHLSYERRYFRLHVTCQRLLQYGEAGRRRPDRAEGQATAGDQNSLHLLQCSGLVREEL